jgi:Xaa-Pro aminopeptidase
MTNLQRMQQALRDAQSPAFLVSNLSSVQWLTGFTGSAGIAIVTPDTGLLITDSRYTLQAAEQCADMPSRTFSNPTSQNDFLYEQMQSLQIRRIGYDEENVTVANLRRWTEKFEGIELFPMQDPVATLRMVKSAEEVRRIREACRLTDACLEHILPMVRPGITEYDLLIEVEVFLRRQGSETAFPAIVVSGERSARPHGQPSQKRLEVGDFVTFDIGARFEGYCSDITRTVVVGEASDRHREVYAQVLKAQTAALEALKPGANGREVDALARRILDEKGLAPFFGHGLGHGLGALVHDSGRLSSSSDQTIETGQVWTVEPGVYLEGFGGVRIEDDALVTHDGVEVLTHFTKELLVV